MKKSYYLTSPTTAEYLQKAYNIKYDLNGVEARVTKNIENRWMLEELEPVGRTFPRGQFIDKEIPVHKNSSIHFDIMPDRYKKAWKLVNILPKEKR